MAITPQHIKTARAWARKQPTENLECRNGRHRFPGITEMGDENIEYNRSEGCYQVVAVCSRCGSVTKTYTVSKSDGMVERVGRYNYDPDYLFRDGDEFNPTLGKDGLGVIRLELLHRWSEDQKNRRALGAAR
jgi:hypothetical protein